MQYTPVPVRWQVLQARRAPIARKATPHTPPHALPIRVLATTTGIAARIGVITQPQRAKKRAPRTTCDAD